MHSERSIFQKFISSQNSKCYKYDYQRDIIFSSLTTIQISLYALYSTHGGKLWKKRNS